MFAKPYALLMSGSEDRHTIKQDIFAKYLHDKCVEVVQQAHAKRFEILRCIRSFLSRVPPNHPVLIAYYGHGTPKGWESKSVRNVSYKDISRIVCDVPHRILFLNLTCYGQFLIKELIGSRSGYQTGVIANWQAFELCYGETLDDLLESWGKNMLPEQNFVPFLYSDKFDSELLPVQRWGSIMDHWFFSQPRRDYGFG